MEIVRTLIGGLGIILIIIGILGLVLPMLQGVLLVLLGLSMVLGKERSKKLVNKVKRWFRRKK